MVHKFIRIKNTTAKKLVKKQKSFNSFQFISIHFNHRDHIVGTTNKS